MAKTAREALERILRHSTEISSECGLLAKELLAWHTRYAPTIPLVSCEQAEMLREKIKRVLWPASWNNLLEIQFRTIEEAHAVVEKLLALVLLRREEPRLVWCEHCEWYTRMDGSGHFCLTPSVSWWPKDRPIPGWAIVAVPDGTTTCPLCSAPRPETS